MTESALPSPPHHQGSGEEESTGLLKGTTTPKVHAKQLWCTLGVVVFLELSVWLSLEMFLDVKVDEDELEHGYPLHPTTLSSPSCSHMTPRTHD